MSNGVAEGVPTTDAVVALGKQYGVPTPLATAMSHVLDDGISCAQMLSNCSAKASPRSSSRLVCWMLGKNPEKS